MSPHDDRTLDFVQRASVPVTQIALAFDAGSAADRPQTRGIAAMTMDLLDEGTSKLSSQQVAEAEERLGADLSASNGADRSYVMLNALSPNLAPSLDLMREMVKDAAFRPADIERIRAQTLTTIAQTQKDPTRVARRLLPVVLYGANHPYGYRQLGTQESVKTISREDIMKLWQQVYGPRNAALVLAGDITPQQARALAEAKVGSLLPLHEAIPELASLGTPDDASSILLEPLPGRERWTPPPPSAPSSKPRKPRPAVRSSTTAPAPSPKRTSVERSVQSRIRESTSPPTTSARCTRPAAIIP